MIYAKGSVALSVNDEVKRGFETSHVPIPNGASPWRERKIAGPSHFCPKLGVGFEFIELGLVVQGVFFTLYTESLSKVMTKGKG